MMKYLFIILFGTSSFYSVSQNYYDTTVCPALAFSDIYASVKDGSIGTTNECYEGTMVFDFPEFCDLQLDWPYSTSFAWTLDSVLWDFGDGTNEIVHSPQQTSHTYSSFGTKRVTAIGYFTGSNGEYCEVPAYGYNYYAGVYYFGTMDPCELVDTTTTVHSVPYRDIIPYYAEIEMSYRQIVECDSSLIYIHFDDIFYQPLDNPPLTYYELLIDGVVVQSNITLSTPTDLYSTYLEEGDHLVELRFMEQVGYPCSIYADLLVTVLPCPDTCESCNTFKPKPGERYWVSAWVKEDHVSQVMNYEDGHLTFGFTGSGQPDLDFYPSGDIIDGWQRIVGSFTIPSGTTDFEIELVNDNLSIDVFFDDIRIHPFNASMKSYVYDPETFWLTAELDDNNYATFYEYDKEGQLIRIKKETARGIMTIQESRSANPKKEN